MIDIIRQLSDELTNIDRQIVAIQTDESDKLLQTNNMLEKIVNAAVSESRSNRQQRIVAIVNSLKRQKATIIATFPLPNDIIELVELANIAITNFQNAQANKIEWTSTGQMTTPPEYEVKMAWKAKFEQVINKLKIKAIQEYYDVVPYLEILEERMKPKRKWFEFWK